ncbi:MAG TPA: BON domain-containing protein [Bacteriovoracaceae bacterium]|nr:BON domain-containing protein [Bacteriovoracaceae bacterium]
MNDSTNKHLFGRSDIEQKYHYHKTTASEELVLSVLKASPEVDISGIQVYVHDNEIHLEGSVEDIKNKRMVESLIENFFNEKLVSRLEVRSGESDLNSPS